MNTSTLQYETKLGEAIELYVDELWDKYDVDHSGILE